MADAKQTVYSEDKHPIAKDNAYNDDMNALVSKLLPLITSALTQKEVGSGKCGCKCANKLASLQKQHDKLFNSVKGYKVAARGLERKSHHNAN